MFHVLAATVSGKPDPETFVSLLKNLPHYEFELFLMAIFDGLIGAILFPMFKRWVRRHDRRVHSLEVTDADAPRVRTSRRFG